MTQDFVALYDLYQEPIFRYCLGKCRDRELAKDLMQQTFMRFWQCLKRNEKILQERAFLYRIAHNLFVDYVRRKKEASLDQLVETGFEPTTDLWHQTHACLDSERPLSTLNAMEASYKQVLYSRFVLGLAPVEIAMLTGESPNTVSVRIFRGLKQLRGLLETV